MQWKPGRRFADDVARRQGRVNTGRPPRHRRQSGAPPNPGGRGTLSSTTNAGADFSPKPPVTAQTPEEQAKTFILPPGYRMELVVAEPDVISPAVIEFDGNGRMYVAEFITYMRDADGNNQHTPESRITRFESTKGDGVYDKRTVFVDKLVLPRMILPLDGNSILTNETASDDVVKYTDTNNDGVADKRELFYSGVGIGRDGNLEHEQSGFVWGLDNWIYSTYNAFRFRWTPTGILKEPTGPNGGQWGLTMDDDGKMWFIDAGGERGPMNFQVPIHYGAFTAPRAVRAGLRDRLAGSRAVGHAGRHDPRAHAGRHGSTTSPRRRAPTSSARTACRPTCAATCSSPSRSAA